jgi:hypothetical protein
MKFFFKPILKVSAFYLEKQKSFIPKKKNLLSRCQYQNIKTLFTGSIFREGFEFNFFRLCQGRSVVMADSYGKSNFVICFASFNIQTSVKPKILFMIWILQLFEVQTVQKSRKQFSHKLKT